MYEYKTKITGQCTYIHNTVDQSEVFLEGVRVIEKVKDVEHGTEQQAPQQVTSGCQQRNGSVVWVTAMLPQCMHQCMGQHE